MPPRTHVPAPAAGVDGALVRLVVTGDDWAESIPPVPRGHEVTVSFSSASSALAHADALEALGYRLVGIQPLSCTCPPGAQDCGAGHPRSLGIAVADFLVSQPLLEAHPSWWRAMADQADRAFNLAMGPVQRLLDSVLRTHAR